MTSEGIGFRHICDWMRYLHNHHDEVNIDELGKALKSFKMKTAWDVFGRMAVEYLGLPEEELPLCPDASRSRKADRLLDMIFISGNFGRFDEKGRDRSKTTYLKQKWRSFRYQNLRLCKLFSLFPSYSITFWWGWLTNGIKVVLQGK